MPGNLYLYIGEKDKVYKVSYKKDGKYNSITEIANEKVLLIAINYSTANRKPLNAQHISFDEIQLNDTGGFEYTSEEIERRLYNFNNYGFMNAEMLSKQDIISLPKSIIIPQNRQKQLLYKYIEQKYPQLMKSLPFLVEQHIRECKQVDLEHKLLVKQAMKLKNNQ
ncbi:MAG: hypothetical protein E6590_17450 [Clostridiales bacterium]|nr:hypothetical protein [Clostridiales bacterium]